MFDLRFQRQVLPRTVMPDAEIRLAIGQRRDDFSSRWNPNREES